MSANKSKGTRWESACRAFFESVGIVARRVAQTGFTDSGDLHGLSPFVAQCKDWRSWEAAIREGLDGAEKQKIHAGERYGVALVKRARRGTGDGYAVMTVRTFAAVLVRLRRAESMLKAADPLAYEIHIEQTTSDGQPPAV